MDCRRFVVRGRVQGVWFRASTRQRAQRLGLRGSAVNRPDGAVEVVACGEATALDALEDWLWQGPELADVSSVERQDLSADAAAARAAAANDGFETA